MDMQTSSVNYETATNEISFLDEALALADKGFFVFPLLPGSASRRPDTPTPLEATRDPGQIIEWFTETPDANIGIATGAEVDLLVVEVAGPIGEESLKAREAKSGPLPETLEASSGERSRYLYFRYPAEVESIKRSLGNNLLISNHYIAAPPSIIHKQFPWGVHSTRYEWVNDQPLEDLPEWAKLRLATSGASRVNPKILARRPLDPETLSGIRDHFHGNVMRAYQTLAPDRPTKYLADQRYEIRCSQNEFYKAMRGEKIKGDFADFIEHLWLCTDTFENDWRSGSLREVPDDPKEWIKLRIGSIQRLHEMLFSDWSYPTLRNVVAGKGTEQNEQELRARLDRFRQRKRHELRALAARDKLAAPESYRRGGLAKRQQIAMESRERKQEKMIEQG